MSSEDLKLRCLGCGRMESGTLNDPTDIAPSTHCSKCKPWTCEICGEICTIDNLCSCWINLEGLPLADIKGYLAAGNLSCDVLL